MVSPEVPEDRRSAVRGERTPFVGTRPFPLENGDRLTRREFERRYAARPDIKKAELIEGVVHMPSPVRFASHGEPHSWVLAWLGTYCASTPGVRVADNTTVRLDSNNEPQPDALLRIEPAHSMMRRRAPARLRPLGPSTRAPCTYLAAGGRRDVVTLPS